MSKRDTGLDTQKKVQVSNLKFIDETDYYLWRAKLFAEHDSSKAE